MNEYDHVLTLGTDYGDPMGGIGQILREYATFYKPFHFIPTTARGGFFKKLHVFILACFRFVLICLFKDIRIVHIHGASRTSFWRKSIFILIARFLSKKIIYHIHGGEFELFLNKNRFIAGKVLNQCDVIVALSHSWKEFFKRHVDGKTQVVVIHNIVPYKEPLLHKRRDGQLVRMAFLGILGERKGIYDMIKLLIKYQDSYRGRLSFSFGGNGEVEQVKKMISEGGIEDLARYEGWVSNEKKETLLREVDFYVLFSWNEGLPVSILEAMSYSLPVISTRVGGIPELVEHEVSGYLVEPGKPEQLKQAIDLMMSNPATRMEMGRESYRRVQPYFPDSVEKSLLHLYGKLLNG